MMLHLSHRFLHHAWLLLLLFVGEANSFTMPRPATTIVRRPPTKATPTRLWGIRCENKYYQLEEMEDKENSTTELFLKEDGTILIGETDGPLWSDASGTWQVKPGTDDFIMTINKKFNAGSKGRDMGEFSFTVTRTYEGDMTHVGESVAITGVMKNGILGEAQDVGFFNMIDGTDIRLDARSDARPGVKGEKDPTLVSKKNDATGTHKGAEGYFVGQPRGTAASSASNLPFGWEEHWDPGQQRHYYVDTTTGTTQWDKPPQPKKIQLTSSTTGAAGAGSKESALPDGWQEHYDPAQQRNYYVDTATGTTQWERPTQQQAQLQQQAMTAFGQSQSYRQGYGANGANGANLPAGWEEHYDPAQQRNFYVDTVRGISQWERPQ